MKRALSDTKLDGGGESSTKLVEVELFRETRKIGVFAKGIVTDLLSAIEMFRRDVVKKGRDVALSAERLAGVDRALAESSDSPFNSVQQLREAISRWHQEHRDRWDADTHYDARRARAYAAHNAVPQKVLTDRALELAGRHVCVALVRDKRMDETATSGTQLFDSLAKEDKRRARRGGLATV